ncbi:MAG TPA: 3'-5' exonuclease [Prolixibacteraceae bacterium]|jgi:ribonuclease D|nr:3'-5' exonuclease [Prolixibacteraceae bacterium]
MYKESIDKDELADMPLIQFEGEIMLVETKEDYLISIEYLAQQKMLGFDTETKPAFKKGVVYEVALLQLATKDRAFLFRLNKIGLPNGLKSILENPEIEKIGVAIRDDIKGLQKLNNFKPGGFIELQEHVKDYGIQDFSLKKLSAIVLGYRISKAQRVTNWEALELSEAQQIYAATDAWISHRIYESLNQKLS